MTHLLRHNRVRRVSPLSEGLTESGTGGGTGEHGKVCTISLSVGGRLNRGKGEESVCIDIEGRR